MAKSGEVEVRGVFLVPEGKDKIEKCGHYLVVGKCGREHFSGGLEGVSGVPGQDETGTVRLCFGLEMERLSCAPT